MDPVTGLDLQASPPLFDAQDLVYYGGLTTLSQNDVKAVIARIVDDSRFLEFKAPFGRNLVSTSQQVPLKKSLKIEGEICTT